MNTIASDKEFVELLKQEENTKSASVKYPTGWTGSGWRAYPSREGGTPTIGYGHKLNPGQTTFDVKDSKGNVVRTINLLKDTITDQQAHDLLIQDIISHEKKAEAEWTKHTPINGVAWGDLDPTYRGMMTEIIFNIGTLEDKNDRSKWGWKKLAKAIEVGDTKEAINQTSRTFNGKQLARVKNFQNLWRPRLKKNTTPTSKSPTVDRIKQLMPSFDTFDRETQTALLVKMKGLDEQKAAEDEVTQREHNSYINKMEFDSNERDRQVQETLEEEQRGEEALAIQQEVQRGVTEGETEALSGLNQRLSKLEQTNGVDNTTPTDIQYFQKPDGSVIKTDSTGTILT